MNAFVYFVGETDIFRYHRSPELLGSLRRDHPTAVLSAASIGVDEAGQRIGEMLDHDQLEIWMKQRPQAEVYATMAALAEVFLGTSAGFKRGVEAGMNSVTYTAFRCSDGPYVIRLFAFFSNNELLDAQGVMHRIVSQMPAMRHYYDQDDLDSGSAYHQIVRR